MNNGNTPTNLNLPPPVPQGEQLPALSVPERDLSNRQVETTPEMAAAPERAAMPTVPAMPIAASPPANSQSSASGSLAGSTPAIADDNDLIEKEWVAKAKQIVEKTKENPYAQNKELSVFKADYMKKRYNKTIKLSE